MRSDSAGSANRQQDLLPHARDALLFQVRVLGPRLFEMGVEVTGAADPDFRWGKIRSVLVDCGTKDASEARGFLDELSFEHESAVFGRVSIFEQYNELEKRFADEVTVLREHLRQAQSEGEDLKAALDLLRAQIAEKSAQPHAEGPLEADTAISILRRRLISSETKTLALADALKKTCEAIDRLTEAVTEEAPCD